MYIYQIDDEDLLDYSMQTTCILMHCAAKALAYFNFTC